jgi:hypothetical protein
LDLVNDALVGGGRPRRRQFVTTLPVELLLAFGLMAVSCDRCGVTVRDEDELACDECLDVIDESLSDEAPDGEDQA